MPIEKLSNLQHIPIAAAYLCCACDAVGNSSTQCPACAGQSLVNLAAVLNREEKVAA